MYKNIPVRNVCATGKKKVTGLKGREAVNKTNKKNRILFKSDIQFSSPLSPSYSPAENTVYGLHKVQAYRKSRGTFCSKVLRQLFEINVKIYNTLQRGPDLLKWR